MIWWLLGALGVVAVAAKKAKRRRVRVPRGQGYRVFNEFDRISASEVAEVKASSVTTGWVLLEHDRARARAVFYADVAARAEDLELLVPTDWQMVAGLLMVKNNDTEARTRILDIRLQEV